MSSPSRAHLIMYEKTNFIRSKKHLQFVASQPCLLCGATDVQACHIRIGFLGLGIKPCDSKTVPLCLAHHTKQHSMNEKKFWESYGLDPFEYAFNLASHSPCKKIKKILISY